MHYVLITVFVLAVIFGPQIWVQRVLNRYNRQPEPDFPGTGGELARHLLDRFDLHDVEVKETEIGDHYDPITCTVALTPDKFAGKTLTAITVAAHECGHAIQHASGDKLFSWRTRLAMSAQWAERVGSFLLFSAPVLVMLTKAPSAALFNLLGAFLVIGFAVAMHLLTLPVELDASFNKALPLLESGYLKPEQMPAARRILRAAALTYVAAALASLLNFWRWLAILRR